MKTFSILVSAVALSSCARREFPQVPFSTRPFGEETKATRVDPQKSPALEPTLNEANFQEVTIAQGSGRDGFDTIRVIRDGASYAVFTQPGGSTGQWDLAISQEEMTGLMEALNKDKITQLAGLYATDLADGTQGFVEIKMTRGSRHTWMSNSFEMVPHTFAYCNRVIWPKVAAAKPGRKNINPQAEYYRVFREE